MWPKGDTDIYISTKTFMQLQKTFRQVQKTFMQVQEIFIQVRLKTFMQV